MHDVNWRYVFFYKSNCIVLYLNCEYACLISSCSCLQSYNIWDISDAIFLSSLKLFLDYRACDNHLISITEELLLHFDQMFICLSLVHWGHKCSSTGCINGIVINLHTPTGHNYPSFLWIVFIEHKRHAYTTHYALHWKFTHL